MDSALPYSEARQDTTWAISRAMGSWVRLEAQSPEISWGISSRIISMEEATMVEAAVAGEAGGGRGVGG